MVLPSLDESVLEGVLGKLADADIPNLWKPKRAQFVAVEALPYLGKGKRDLKRLQRLALEMG